LNALFSFGFAWVFSQIGWMPHGGLALANSFATALEAVALFIIMRKRLDGIEGREILRGVIPSMIAAIGMGLAVFGWMALGAKLSVWVLAPVGIGIGGIVYFAVLLAMRVPELSYVVNAVMRRIRR
jgi:putative peptidoglycan lipid II flippase